jgi:hypothetical protein
MKKSKEYFAQAFSLSKTKKISFGTKNKMGSLETK